jgi:hypothetical protein
LTYDLIFIFNLTFSIKKKQIEASKEACKQASKQAFKRESKHMRAFNQAFKDNEVDTSEHNLILVTPTTSSVATIITACSFHFESEIDTQ